jgi:hypothetical protein
MMRLERSRPKRSRARSIGELHCGADLPIAQARRTEPWHTRFFCQSRNTRNRWLCRDHPSFRAHASLRSRWRRPECEMRSPPPGSPPITQITCPTCRAQHPDGSNRCLSVSSPFARPSPVNRRVGIHEYILFNKSPEQLRLLGAWGGRAYGRNQGDRRAQMPVRTASDSCRRGPCSVVDSILISR